MIRQQIDEPHKSTKKKNIKHVGERSIFSPPLIEYFLLQYMEG